MTTTEKPKTIHLPQSGLPRIVVIGAGFAGISFVKQLANKPFQVVILDSNNFHQFQPLLYQVATSGIEPDSIVFPLRKMFKGYRNVHFRMVEVSEIKASEKTIETNSGQIAYDYLVMATGSTNNFFGMADLQQHSLGMKSIQEALDIRSLILQNLEKAVVTNNPEEREALTNFTIIGGGPAGVETAGAIAEFKNYILPKDYPELDSAKMSIHLIEADDQVLKAMNPKSSAKAYKYLTRMGVDVQLNTTVKSYDGLNISTNNPTNLKSKTVIWTAGVKGNTLTGIDASAIVRGNRIVVDETSKIIGSEHLYAIGDIAFMKTEDYPNGHPMVAQVALQQGKLLAQNIYAASKGKKQKPFKYNDKGSLATIGKRKAVANLGKFEFGGYFAWIIWSVVHLLSIAGFRNKLFVGINWAWSYFTYDKGNRLIIRPFKEK